MLLHGRRRLGVLSVISVGLAIAVPAVAAAQSVGPPAPALTWASCDNGFQCATARVPLDYRQPNGPAIDIAVIRHPATDPTHRIGSLFVNGGGPSEQVDALVAAYPTIPPQLRADYDIVDFDPRGFGHSTAIRCFPTEDAENAFLSPAPTGFPVGAAQIAAWDRTYAAFDRKCADTHDPLLEHDTTADVARDMDLLRQAVGAPALNYIGLSYGTGLGAIYANLFPDKVGHMVLDGNLDPVAWTTDTNGLPMFLREGSDLASAKTLEAFLNLCGQAPTSACAFSAGTPAATRAKYSTLLDRLAANPVTVTLPGQPPVSCGYACGVGVVPLGTTAAWPTGASMLQQLWVASGIGGTTTEPARTKPDDSSVYTGLEQHFAVLCSDAPNPRNPNAYAGAARSAAARSGPEGPQWTWATEPCADWPRTQDAYTGPWNRPTANPILVIANTGDPATPYQDSQAMAHDLARARLLTVDQYGHTEFQNQDTCATNYELTYLATGALPPAGTVCPQPASPF